MSRAALGFFTHLDLDRLYGGGPAGSRARQRQTRDGLLPQARWAQVGRARIGFFAELALVRLVVAQTASRHEQRVLRDVVALHNEVVHDELFDAIVGAAVDWLGSCGGRWNLSALNLAVADRVPDQLARWHCRLDEDETTLAETGLHIVSRPARVAHCADDLVTIALEGRRVLCSARHATNLALDVGAEIAVDHVELLGRSEDFLVPAMKREPTALAASEAGSSEEQFAMSPFADSITAVLSGRIARNVPPRFVGDADTALSARLADERVADEMVARFAEEPHQPEVPRSGFHPPAARR